MLVKPGRSLFGSRGAAMQTASRMVSANMFFSLVNKDSPSSWVEDDQREKDKKKAGEIVRGEKKSAVTMGFFLIHLASCRHLY